jgi:STE24 endopeptidase
MVQFNSLLMAFLVLFALRFMFQLVLNRLNISHLRKYGNEVPRIFQGTVDGEKLARISAYTVDSANFGLVVTLFDQVLLLTILLSGFLPWLAEAVNRWQPSFIVRGLAFFAVFFVISHLLNIPFGLYGTFVIEKSSGVSSCVCCWSYSPISKRPGGCVHG